MAACSTGTVTATVPATATEAPATTTTPDPMVGRTTVAPGDQFPRAVVMVGETELHVWVGDDPEERAQGLRGVDDLPPDLDGMLFVFDTPVPAVFVMEDTLIPLDIWFFDEQGALVGTHEMTPCSAAPCPRYPAPSPVRWALETPLGHQDFRAGDLLSTSASG